MNLIHTLARLTHRRLPQWLPALLVGCISLGAAAQTDPPGRVASLSHRQGTVIFAPAGDNEWLEAPLNRPLTRGDRLWSDRGALAELHLGAAALQLNGMTHLDITELDDDAVRLRLTQGTLNARVRELDERENFEIGTPNLALRVLQPGDYRVDVDPYDGNTRVTVRIGRAVVYGADGQSYQVSAGQQIAFGDRGLIQSGGYSASLDAFDQWAAERNRREDRSRSARYLPRQVIGYAQLDEHGSWSSDASYGPIWYPHSTVANWAPYRHGHWDWIQPWGWTWIDEAPWGFAPFHYGRWALIGSRWAWVPGSFAARPVYAPALVVFVGGGAVRASLSIGSGSGIAWYPLAPGEAWRPSYRTSPVYLTNVNRAAVLNHQVNHAHLNRQRPEALTAVRVEDFSRGRPVGSNWKAVNPHEVTQAVLGAPPPRRPGLSADSGRLVRPAPPVQTPRSVLFQPGAAPGRFPAASRSAPPPEPATPRLVAPKPTELATPRALAPTQPEQPAPRLVAPRPAESPLAPRWVAPKPAEDAAPRGLAPKPPEPAPRTVTPKPAEDTALRVVAPKPSEPPSPRFGVAARAAASAPSPAASAPLPSAAASAPLRGFQRRNASETGESTPNGRQLPRTADADDARRGPGNWPGRSP